MGALKKKKKTESNEEVEHQDSVKVEKKKPVKAQPIDNGVGGIFTNKVVAIMKKLLEKD